MASCPILKCFYILPVNEKSFPALGGSFVNSFFRVHYHGLFFNLVLHQISMVVVDVHKRCKWLSVSAGSSEVIQIGV